jgi:hypothetical protein
MRGERAIYADVKELRAVGHRAVHLVFATAQRNLYDDGSTTEMLATMV